MGITNLPNGVSSFGIPQIGSGIPVVNGKYWFVSGSAGSLNKGTKSNPFTTVGAAITAASAGDCIILAPGSYDEAVTINKGNLTIFGMGGRGAAYVAPTTTNATGVLVTANDVTLVNVGCDGDGTGPGLHVQGDVSRFRASHCKIEGDNYDCRLESTASGAVGDSWFYDCEFAWGATAFHFKVSGGGDPVTQTRIEKCLFHNFATVGVHAETTHTADVWITDSTFAAAEDGTEPTDYLLLDVASTTGVVDGCRFAIATNAAAQLTIAAGVQWLANATEAGWSTARPA